MNFSKALEALKGGDKILRTAWKGQGRVGLQVPGKDDAMTDPFLYLNMGGVFIPWVPNQADMLAEDWQVWGASPIQP